MAALDAQASSTHCNPTSQCIPCTKEQQGSEAACRATGFHQEITCTENFGSHRSASGSGSRGRSGSLAPDAPADANGTGNTLGDVQGSEGRLKAQQREAQEAQVAAASKAEAEEGVEEKEGGGRAARESEPDDEVGRSLRGTPEEGVASRQLSSSGKEGEENGADGQSAAGTEPQQDRGGSEQGAHGHGFRKYVAFEACNPIEEETLSVFGFEAIMLSLLIVCAPVVYQRKRKAVAAIAMTRMPNASRV